MVESKFRREELEIVHQAVFGSAQRVRRTLLVIITVACIGFFHLYMWYFSWQKARMVGREHAIEQLQSLQKEGKTYSASRALDDELVKSAVTRGRSSRAPDRRCPR